MDFLIHIEYTHLRQSDLAIPMKPEITHIFFYLTKDGLIQKPTNSEFTTELKLMVSKLILTSLTSTSHEKAVIDFLVYASKVPIKK